MIDRQAASRAANAFIATIRRNEKAGPLALREDLTIEKSFGWVFFYDFQRFLDTKESRFAANGNAPIIVDRLDGSVHVTGTARPIEHYIAAYEKKTGSGRPFKPDQPG